MPTYTAAQIAQLAPDAASNKAAAALGANKWPLLEKQGNALWGHCQGSGKNPYQTAVDLSAEPAFKCSCPSRKFPCKHGLALLLRYAENPERFQEGPTMNGSPQHSSPADTATPSAVPDTSPTPEDRKPAPRAVSPEAAPSPVRQPDSAPVTDNNTEKSGNSASPANSSTAKTDAETAAIGSDTITDAPAAPAKADNSVPADTAAAASNSTAPDVPAESGNNVTPDAPAAPGNDKAAEAPATTDTGAASDKAQAPADDGASAPPKVGR